MKIKEILESATAGATSSASIATVPNPHLSPGKARGKKSYTGSPWTGSGTKSPPQPKPKKQKPTDNALDMKTSLFGEGNAIRREGVAEGVDIVGQDSDLDQQVFTLNVDGKTVSFTYWDYENNFQSPDIKDIYQQAREQLGKKLSPEQIKAVARSVFKSFKSGVAEGLLDEGKGSDVAKALVGTFNAAVGGDRFGPLEVTGPGTRVWTRGDGVRHRDPGKIKYENDAAIKKWPGAIQKFWQWLSTQPGVSSIGQVSGEFGSSPMQDAVTYKGLYFALKQNSIVWGSASRFKNPRSVWRQKSPEAGVAEGSGKNVVKSVKVGNFRHDLVDTGFGWQVRIYNGDELHDTGLSKNSEQKGLAALEDAVAYTEKQTNTKRQGVAEGSESTADIDKKIEFHKQGQAAAQYKGSMNKMHAAKIRELEAKKKALKQGVAEAYDGEPGEYHVLRHQTKFDIDRELLPKAWTKVKQFDSYQEAKQAYETMKSKYPKDRFTITSHKRRVGEGMSQNDFQVHERISVASNTNYKQMPNYKNYEVYVSKKPVSDKYGYIAYTEVGREEFKAPGKTPHQAVAGIHEKIDRLLNAAKVSNNASIDFNVNFANEILSFPGQPFFAKIENIGGDPKLIIAGELLLSEPKEMGKFGFQRAGIRNAKIGSDESTKLPVITLGKARAERTGLIPNGRYLIGKEREDDIGNRVFDLVYHSTVQSRSDVMRLNKPALTVGTTRGTESERMTSESNQNQMDTPEFQRALASVKKQAAQGPKKTVYDPKTGKYKVVPVKDKKEGSYESKLLDKLNRLVENLDSAEYNDEAGMAENNLHTLARAVEGLLDTIKSNDNLPEWVQEKIAKAEMILVTVWDYLLSQKEQGIDPEIK